MRTFIALLMLLGCKGTSGASDDEISRRVIMSTIAPHYAESLAKNKDGIGVNISRVDLNGDGTNEVLAYVKGDDVCGSGGCNLFVLQAKDGHYDTITELSITWPPIRILDSKSNAWQDLGVWVQGGGIQPGYEARLRFDGKIYPSNPSLVPRTESGSLRGRVVIERSSPATPLHI